MASLDIIMDTILLALFAAIGYLIVCCKLIGLKNTVRYQAILDIVFTVGGAIVMAGTFSGMAVAIMAGVFFSILIYTLGLITRPLKHIRT